MANFSRVLYMVKEFRTLEISVLILWFPLVVKCENGRLGSECPVFSD